MILGTTKAEVLLKAVLVPKAVGDVLKTLKSSLPFSTKTDASNKGNWKMFPLAVQNFSPECGITIIYPQIQAIKLLLKVLK